MNFDMSNSIPQPKHDFDLDDSCIRRSLMSKLKRSKYLNKFIETDVMIIYVVLEDPAYGGISYVFSYDRYSEDMGYCLSFVKHKVNDDTFLNKLVIQVSIWRSRTVTFSTFSLAKDIFYGFFIKKYGVVMSDQMKSDSSTMFWQRRMMEIINKRERLNMYQYICATKNLIPIINGDDCVHISRYLSSHKNEDKDRFIIISKELISSI